MTEVKTNRLYLAIIIVIQLGICIFAGTHKKNFFCDEIFSYGLANSEDYTFIDPQSAEQYSSTGWVDEKYFRQYIEVDGSSGLSFEAAFQNQEKDVHPPFYYCLLHIACWLFRGSFSKWTGIGLNLLVLVLTDLLLLYLADGLFRDVKKSAAAMMLWSCSAAGLSNILFIRMYLLLTCEMLAFAAVHARWVQGRGRWKIKESAVLLLLTAAGGLTHYYFYLYVLFFSGMVCFVLLLCKKIGMMLRYGLTLAGGGLLALGIFPGTAAHIFQGYRGTEVWDNLSGREENVYGIYLKWVDQSMFGGCFWLLMLVCLAAVVWKGVQRYLFTFRLERDQHLQTMVLRIQKAEQKGRGEYCVEIRPVYLVFLLMLAASAMFGMAAAKGSNLLSNRYIYPVYPVIAVWVVMAVLFCIRQTVGRRYENGILAAVTVLLCVLSVRVYGIDFMYSDYAQHAGQAEQVRGTDCLLYYGDEWLDVYTSLPLKQIYDETYFLHPGEIEDISEILMRRGTEDPVVVCLPDQWAQEEAEGVLGRIMEAGGFTGYQMSYHYYTQAYLMQ